MPQCAIFLQHFSGSLSYYLLPGEELLIGGRRPPQKWQEVSPERSGEKKVKEPAGEIWRKISRPLFPFPTLFLPLTPLTPIITQQQLLPLRAMAQILQIPISTQKSRNANSSWVLASASYQ